MGTRLKAADYMGRGNQEPITEKATVIGTQAP